MHLNLSSVPKSNENIILPETVTEELAEETGLHIGDGSMNFYKNKGELKGLYQLRGHMTDDKKHYDQIIKKLYKNLYDFDLKLRNMPSTGVYGFQKWSNNLVYFKNKILHLPLGKKYNISVPKVFTNKHDLMEGVIRGIFDTDGMLYLQPKYGRLYPRIEISTISKVLGLQLNKMINQLNIRSTVYTSKRNSPQLFDVYKVSIRGCQMLDKWMETIKPHNPKHANKYKIFIKSL